MRRRVTKRHLRKPRILFLIVLVLLLVGWLIWSSLFAQPAKRDYEQALERTQALGQSQERLKAASSEYVQDIVSSLRFKLDGSNIARDTKESAASYRQELESYRQAARYLDSSRVSRDDDVEPALLKAREHSERLIATVQSLGDDYDELYRAYTACDPVIRFSANGTNAASRYDDVSRSCLDELDELSNVSTAELADYAKQARELIRKKRELYASSASSTELQAVDVRLMRLSPLSRVQQLTGDLFDTSELQSLRVALERKRDES